MLNKFGMHEGLQKSGWKYYQKEVKLKIPRLPEAESSQQK